MLNSIRYSQIVSEAKKAVLVLPWRSVILFDVLLIACGLLAARFMTFLHEIGHLFVAYLFGADIYGIYIRPLTHYYEGFGAYALFTLYTRGPGVGFLINFAGVSVNLLTALITLPLILRLRANSVWRVFGTLFVGSGILGALWYLVSGYYSNYGDFSGWREATAPLGDFIWLFLIFLCPVAGHFLGKLYIVLQECRIPSRSSSQRTLISFFTIGVIYCPLVIFMTILKSYPLVLLVGILSGIGGLAAFLRSNPGSPTTHRFHFRALAVPVFLMIAIESFLLGNDGNLFFPHRKFPTKSSIQYDNGRIIRIPDAFVNLDLDEHGNLYWVSYEEKTLRMYRPRKRESEILLDGLHRPLRLKVSNARIYILERSTDPGDGRIGFYDIGSGKFRVILEGLERPRGLDVDDNGNVYFTQNHNQLCVLKNGEKEKAVLRDDLPGAGDVALDSQGNLYVAIAPWGREAENGSLVKLSKDGRRKELIATDLSTPMDLDIDEEGNIYIAGAGYSSITLIPKGGDSEPVSLRGSLKVLSLAVSESTDIYYVTLEKSRHYIEVFRRKDNQ